MVALKLSTGSLQHQLHGRLAIACTLYIKDSVMRHGPKSQQGRAHPFQIQTEPFAPAPTMIPPPTPIAQTIISSDPPVAPSKLLLPTLISHSTGTGGAGGLATLRLSSSSSSSSFSRALFIDSTMSSSSRGKGGGPDEKRGAKCFRLTMQTPSAKGKSTIGSWVSE